MIDSGADVSAITPNLADRQRPNSGFTLQAVNRTSIKSYGQRMLKHGLGLRRSFPHVFIIADVPHPIIGADFLNDSTFPSVFAGGASLMTQLAYQ